jgi:hypothetical protein
MIAAKSLEIGLIIVPELHATFAMLIRYTHNRAV